MQGEEYQFIQEKYKFTTDFLVSKWINVNQNLISNSMQKKEIFHQWGNYPNFCFFKTEWWSYPCFEKYSIGFLEKCTGRFISHVFWLSSLPTTTHKLDLVYNTEKMNVVKSSGDDCSKTFWRLSWMVGKLQTISI